MIFATLVGIIAVGQRFGTIAFNPARLIAPAVVAQTTGGAQTLGTM